MNNKEIKHDLDRELTPKEINSFSQKIRSSIEKALLNPDIMISPVNIVNIKNLEFAKNGKNYCLEINENRKVKSLKFCQDRKFTLHGCLEEPLQLVYLEEPSSNIFPKPGKIVFRFDRFSSGDDWDLDEKRNTLGTIQEINYFFEKLGFEEIPF